MPIRLMVAYALIALLVALAAAGLVLVKRQRHAERIKRMGRWRPHQG